MNSAVIVIWPLTQGLDANDGSDHPHGGVLVRVRGHDHGLDQLNEHGDDHGRDG